jgi:hypothetical protein
MKQNSIVYTVTLGTIMNVVLPCSTIAGDAPTSRPVRSDWFHQARWGVFTHYMADTVGLYDGMSSAERDQLLGSDTLSNVRPSRSARSWSVRVPPYDPATIRCPNDISP